MKAYKIDGVSVMVCDPENEEHAQDAIVFVKDGVVMCRVENVLDRQATAIHGSPRTDGARVSKAAERHTKMRFRHFKADGTGVLENRPAKRGTGA